MLEGGVNVACSAAENINLAFYQNAVPIVRELTIENVTGREVSGIEIHLSSEPPFVSPGVWRIDKIADNDIHHLRVVDLKLDHGFLAAITASRRGEIRIRVEAAGEQLADHKIEVNLLPPAHWGGSGSAPELLAAFVRPTDPSVDVILREASGKLAKAGRNPAVDGYSKGKKARAWEIAEAIWAALVEHSISYVLPPKSFEREGQLVRSPNAVLSRKVGTCLDLTLLYASCLEQAGLNPLVILTAEHAFAGVWLVDEDFSTPVIDDAQMLRKRVQLDEMILVETTALTGQHPAKFKQAVAQGAKHIAEDAKAPLELAIDVKRARAARIRPLDLGGSSSTAIDPKTEPTQPHELEAAPVFEEDLDRSAPAPERPLDRLEIWKSNLLDLTLRNRLLNFKENKATISVECPDPAKLEDLLAAGKRFKMQGRATVLDGSDGRDPALFGERQNEDGRKAYVLEAMDRGELHAQAPDAEIEGRLTDLYRASRLAFEEGGSNVLYLCLGFLKWSPQDGAGPYRAPLLMVPVQLERKSVRSGFRLALHEDEVLFNPTLLQMLRRDFSLSMPEFEGDLLSDGSGVDVAGIWKIVRQHVKGIRGWEVTEQVVLATLSFTKYLMWKDLVDRTDDLKRNPVVRHLIDTPTHTYEGGSADFIEPQRLDEAVEPADLFAPLSADSSQIAAVVAAQHGKDFVLFGPPGTGKSQTIANMISNCLAHGRSVLFVSQKTAALEVVRRRLLDVGLGSYCLEVHSTKAQKSSVVAQLADAWRSRTEATEEHWEAATSELKAKRDELNRLVSALHRRRASGRTAYEFFGRVIADRDVLPDVGLSWAAGTVHSADALAAMRTTCVDLRTALLAVGDPSRHPLRGIEQTKWTPAWTDDLARFAERLTTSLVSLKACAELFAASIGFEAGSWDLADVHHLAAFGALLMRPEAVDGAILLEDDAGERIRALRAASDLVERARAKSGELSGAYDLRAVRLDLAQLQRDWVEACTANFLVRGSKKNKVRLALNPYCKAAAPDDIGRDLVVLQDLARLTAEAERLAPYFVAMEQLWRGLDTDASRFEPIIVWAVQAREAARNLGDRTSNAEQLRQHCALLVTGYGHLFAIGGEAREAFESLQTTWTSTRAAAVDLGVCIGLEDPTCLLTVGPGWIEELLQRLDRWKANLVKAPQWARWRFAATAGQRAGLRPLVAAIESGSISGDLIAPVFEYGYAKWSAAEVVNHDEVLSSFLAEQHEAVIEAFVAADRRVADLSKQIVRARIGGAVPSLTTFGKDPEWGALAHEVHKKARYMPLRQLFGKIPSVLTQLAPCVMMSSLSIAQYLPPDAKPFDVVIFDEASQIPVWDAIGAIARGNQVVVVGDPEQLPPTNVGQRAADEQEDDSGAVQSQQSILDECLSSNLPSLRLVWHYRSRHESLIAFSNARYYRGELVTFPSPFTRDTAVRYVPVEGGVYERGAAKVNRKEAQAVVDEVLVRVNSSPQSIGVVTFNAEQQRLIENLLDQARRSEPSLDRHFDRAQTAEPLFVKNIENVQGDERDVIIFSVAVGPDQTGRITAQISSLNGEGGHRRLNVAVTRARRELLVFSTMRPEQIDLGRTSARGVVDFKHFLEFAKNGIRAIAEAFAATGRGTESPFEDAVKRAFEAKGWEVHPQIGVSFFRVDLGIVHPDEPGRYLAGIECDGATYHRSATARDRDRLREMVLTDLGWRIRRIWSTEWWMDSASALEKIHTRLLADLEADRAATTVAALHSVSEEEPAAIEDGVSGDDAEPPTGMLEPGEELPPEPANDAPPVLKKLYARNAATERPETTLAYVPVELASVGAPDRTRFYEVGYRSELRTMVDHVVEVEGPIFFDLVVDRIARAHGFQRAKDGIRGVVKAALGRGRFPTTEEGDREIVWPKDSNPTLLPLYRGAEHREHGDIPLPELASLAALLRADGFMGEDLVRAMQEHFQLGRLASSTRARFGDAIALVERSA